MSEKHTTGPWKVSHESNGTFIRGAHGGLVASLEAGYQAMRDADARPISAAPELLEALEDLTAWMEMFPTDSQLDAVPRDGATGRERYAKARAAIRKAVETNP